MIVATPPSVSPATPVDGTPTGELRGSTVDATRDDPAKPTFGKRLQQAVGKAASGHDDTKGTTKADDATDAAADAMGTQSLSLAPTDVIVCGAAVPPPSDAAPTTSKDDATSTDAGADLAAQLALVSQWVGAAHATPAANPANPAKTDDATSPRPTDGDALGIADKLAVLRNDGTRAAGGSGGASTKGITNSKNDAIARFAADATPDRPTSAATIAGATPALAATIATTGAGAGKDAVERTVAALDATQATNGASTTLAATLIQTAAAVANAETGTAPTALREPVGTPAWSEEFGKAAVHVATTGLKEASLRLNPEHLGPLDVRVRIDDGVAHLSFQAAHVETRHALESSRPMLDQLFSNQGLSIGDYSVADHGANDAQARFAAMADGSGGGSGRGGRSDASTPDLDPALDRAVAARLAKPLGLVDTFA